MQPSRMLRSQLPRLSAVRRALLAGAVLACAVPAAEAGPRERALTDALIWLGASERVARERLDLDDREAIARIEQRLGLFPDGRLDPREEGRVLHAADRIKRNFGYRMTLDPRTGIEIGVPTAVVSAESGDADGAIWASRDGVLEIETFRFGEETTLADVEDRERDGPDTEITYGTGGSSWFVLSGYRDGRTFYSRAKAANGEVRGYRVIYSGAERDRLDRVVVALSSDFRPFAGAGAPLGGANETALENGTDDEAAGAALDTEFARAATSVDGTLEGATEFAALPARGPDIASRPRQRPQRSFGSALDLSSEFVGPMPLEPEPEAAPAAPQTVRVPVEVRRVPLGRQRDPLALSSEGDDDDAGGEGASSAVPAPSAATEPETARLPAPRQSPPEAAGPAGDSPAVAALPRPSSLPRPGSRQSESTNAPALPRPERGGEGDAVISGMITEEGRNCRTLRSTDGKLYELVGDLPEGDAGALVTLRGREIEPQICGGERTFLVRQHASGLNAIELREAVGGNAPAAVEAAPLPSAAPSPASAEPAPLAADTDEEDEDGLPDIGQIP